MTKREFSNGDLDRRYAAVADYLDLDKAEVETGARLLINPDDPLVPRDHLGEPWPRYRYVSQEIAHQDQTAKRPIPQFNQLRDTLDTLLKAHSSGDSLYGLDHVILPQDPRNVPYELFNSDRELANFFAVSCLWMRRTNSVKAMRSVGEMYRETRELAKDPFDPRVAAEMTDSEILGILKPHPQLQMRHFTVPAFRENAAYIRDRFDGDIRGIYVDTADYKTIVNRAKNTDGVIEGSKGLQGFQHKMVSMLLYYLADADSIDQPSEKVMPYFDFPLPVDMHVARFSAGTNCVRMQGYRPDENILTENLQQVLRDMYYDYSLAHGTNQLTVANVVWLLGSWFCSYSPETFSTIKHLDGRNSRIEPYLPDYSRNTRDFSAWLATCGNCPVAELCTHVSPGKESHILGTVTRRPRRRSVDDSGLVATNDLKAVALNSLSIHAKNRGMEWPQKAQVRIEDDLPEPPTLF